MEGKEKNKKNDRELEWEELVKEVEEVENKEDNEENNEGDNRGGKDKVCLVYVTCPDQEAARFIAKKCLDRKLVACANIFPEIESLYTWQGKLEEDKESVLILKTKKSNQNSLKKLISSLHKYDCPCILFIDVIGGHESFMEWVFSRLTS